ncbi:MAG: hypothetical protein ACREOJ_18730, partial [Gemmatimonadaceae bacterium]
IWTYMVSGGYAADGSYVIVSKGEWIQDGFECFGGGGGSTQQLPADYPTVGAATGWYTGRGGGSSSPRTQKNGRTTECNSGCHFGNLPLPSVDNPKADRCALATMNVVRAPLDLFLGIAEIREAKTVRKLLYTYAKDAAWEAANSFGEQALSGEGVTVMGTAKAAGIGPIPVAAQVLDEYNFIKACHGF